MAEKCIHEPLTPVTPPQRHYEWLVKVDNLSEVTKPSFDHAYITPNNEVWVLDHDGQTLIPLGSSGISAPTILENTDGYLSTAGSEGFNQVLNFNTSKIDGLIQDAIDEIVVPEYVKLGLRHRFDTNNNDGSGTHNPTTTIWKDLVGGADATLTDVTWTNGAELNGNTSRISYDGIDVREYTIFTTVAIQRTGIYPRIFGENPYPSLYLSNTNSYIFYFYGQGKDRAFLPTSSPSYGNPTTAAIRFTGTVENGGSGTVELFVNGVKAGEVEDVLQYPTPVSPKFLGSRNDNTRTMTGRIFEHLVYDRALSDEEIYNNYLASKHNYPIL